MMSHTWRWLAALAWIAGVINCSALLSHTDNVTRQQHEPAQELIHDGRGILGVAETIILVRVVEYAEPPFGATVLVLKSWKGPFSAGRVLHDRQPIFVCGIVTDCDYQFQARDNELLMFTHSTREPIVAGSAWVWPAAEAHELMRALDQAVKEEQELQARHREESP